MDNNDVGNGGALEIDDRAAAFLAKRRARMGGAAGGVSDQKQLDQDLAVARDASSTPHGKPDKAAKTP